MTQHERPNVLWVYAHPTARSMNHALMVEGVRALSTDHDVVVSDLYAQRWNPVLSVDDLGDTALQGSTFGDATKAAYQEGRLPEDVRREQARLRAADVLVLQFPLWWTGMPAILKGWVDRVFSHGFAFGVKDPDTGHTRKYGDGGLAGRRALAITTAGDRSSAFGPRGINGDADSLMFPITHGLFWYTGMAPLWPHVITATDTPGWDSYEAERAALVHRLRDVGTETPIPFRHMRGGDYDDDRMLRPDVAPGRTDLAMHQIS
ncbi:MAG TPA: NAD(P)H-dependent oxidoreductase [Beutenbergiaceae bacterium]|nr:NAD(P)H-dependent oxidoreductase [Beutenbergiaceae bacterium]